MEKILGDMSLEDYNKNELRYPSKETIKRLTKEFNLKGADKYTQDWEYEVADVNQLSSYINFYKNNRLNVNEKSTLMRVILEAYNDYSSLRNQEDIYGETIKEILKEDYPIHKETIMYWSCEDDDLANCFAISLFIRKLR